ncbi:MAG: hypothetical protein HN855_00605 [Anaerolineae bacterium]|jgi:hypothetical protein|nr:hypothetical protein [Anaerolineae bacterium]MBT7069701.1 hypothetical protein [Anaerolineae bacterium]MBT7323641.1 hypothetical protein [Anaerolineae bacterium]
MKKTIFALMMILTLALSACGGAATETASSGLNADYENALSVQLQLSVGTFNLEGTDLVVDAEQAAELLPLWQVLNSLNESSTAAPEEIDALVAQIEETMTVEQIESIAAMQLTREEMGVIMQEYAISMGGGETPPEGVTPGQGRGGSDVPGLEGGGPGRGGDTGMTPEQIATAQAEREANGGGAGSMGNSRISSVIVEGLIELLQSK